MKPVSLLSRLGLRIARLVLITLALPLSAAAQDTAQAPDMSGDCRVGSYQLADGSRVDIGPGEGQELRWRRKDGTTGALTEDAAGHWNSTLGWTGRSDDRQVTFSSCADGGIHFGGIAGTRIAFDTTETRFAGAAATLAGRLVLPRGNGPVPIVVLVHGSEHMSARDFYAQQRLFPSEGVGVFVYDKRGTGASGGRYTQDYLTLATDAIAAMHEARRLAGSRAGRIGYQGGSQGGWVAPLAARIEPVDFVIVSFGLAVSPAEEDREAIAYDMQRQSYGPDVMAKAMEVADAAAIILRSEFREGYRELDAVRAKYGNEPWFKHVHGDITFALLEMSEAKLREQGPLLLAGVPVDYDPMPVLRNLDVPQLWILGTDDTDAPSAETLRRLHALAEAGRPISTALFPRADHGIYEYETKADGSRVSTRNSEGYFALMCDFILHGRIGSHYGEAQLVTRKEQQARGR